MLLLHALYYDYSNFTNGQKQGFISLFTSSISLNLSNNILMKWSVNVVESKSPLRLTRMLSKAQRGANSKAGCDLSHVIKYSSFLLSQREECRITKSFVGFIQLMPWLDYKILAYVKEIPFLHHVHKTILLYFFIHTT